MGSIIAFAGNSGAGKSKQAGLLIETVHESRMVPSNTTRPLRGNEIDGEYVWVSEKEMLDWEAQGDLMWPIVHGTEGWYCTSRSDVTTILECEDMLGIMILEPDVIPIVRDFVIEHTGDATRFSAVFLYHPDVQVLSERLRARGASEVAIDKRIKRESGWRDWAKKSGIFHFVCTEGPVEVTYEEVLRYLPR